MSIRHYSNNAKEVGADFGDYNEFYVEGIDFLLNLQISFNLLSPAGDLPAGLFCFVGLPIKCSTGIS